LKILKHPIHSFIHVLRDTKETDRQSEQADSLTLKPTNSCQSNEAVPKTSNKSQRIQKDDIIRASKASNARKSEDLNQQKKTK